MSPERTASQPSAKPERFIADLQGARSGPTLIVVGGLHANEPAGIEAALRVTAGLQSSYPIQRGRFVAIRGHLSALECTAAEPWLRPRYLDVDLNRLFTPNPQQSDARDDLERAELSQALERLAKDSAEECYLIDLHTVSSDSPAFVAFEDSLPARRFAMRFPLPKIVGMEEELDGLLMDHATREHGMISCIVESGRHDKPASADVHEAVVLLAATALGIAPADARTRSNENPFDVTNNAAGRRGERIYDVRHRASIGSPDFKMRQTAVAFQRIKAGRTVVADESGGPITPRLSGLLFMPNRQHNARVGDDAYFIIKQVSPAWLALSEWLRTKRLTHRLVPRLLPGVCPHAGHANQLCIDPDVAVFLRREVLHLLGYRLIQHHHPPRRSLVTRICRAFQGFAASAIRLVRYPFTDTTPPPRSPRRDDWVARLRRLDRTEKNGANAAPSGQHQRSERSQNNGQNV